MRRTAIKIHLWLGLTLGLLWAIQGTTGALYVFAREYDRLEMPKVVHGPPASLDDVLAAARQVAGAARIERLAMTDGKRDLIDVYYHDAKGDLVSAQLDASSGKRVGARPLEPATPWAGSVTRWIYMIHMRLNAGAPGELIIAISGLFLLSASALGLWIGWPRARMWRKTFAAGQWRSPDQRLYGWHRAVGLLAAMALIVMGGTGFMLNTSVVEDLLQKIVPFHKLVGGMHHAGMAGMMHPDDAPHLSAQQALEIATARIPDGQWVRVFMPNPDQHFYSVRLHRPAETRAWLGATSVVVDSDTGEVVDVYDAVNAPLANRVMDAVFAVHSGEIGGLPGRMLVLLVGLSLPFFYVTGVWAWFRKAKRKRNSARRKAGTVPIARPNSLDTGEASAHSA
ncbi:PepSY domain-containing protein [Novosphingobium sp. AP12]|uniref:PepSY-associated TM helix domain-containing protein n=1 Tax=Novosphingobium sp. AP12 TaxID=1144305 RepID=UPI000271F1B3|nr:PepSY-associated TM helix domain-containing protein [Novosphingobium sp. AP12]EJL24226.1 putative iron-regulated membrane protein [Novosphingobium sp. AP12]